MNSPKVRKSWFCASPTTVQLASTVSQTPSPDLTCQLIVDSTDENQEPTCVTASDVLTLTTFSPRAVIDFGTETFTGHPFVRYLLLENPHDEDQSVSIQRGLPADEFTLTWIGSDQSGPTQPTSSWKTPGLCPTSDSIYVRGPRGRCLLRISWNPTKPQPLTAVGAGDCSGFHHLIQFRVNGAFPLQALVVGRLLPAIPDRKARPKRPPHFKPIGLSIPHEVTSTQRPFSQDRFHAPQTVRPSMPLGEHRQRTGCATLERSFSAQLFDDEMMSLEPRKQLLKSISLKHLQLPPKAPSEDPMPDWVSRVPSTHRGLPRQSVSLTHLPGPGTLDNVSPPMQKQRSTALNLSFLNATAVGFVSPKLIRSPALKGDPQLTLPSEPCVSSRLGPVGGGNLFYPDFTFSLSELSEHGLTQWLNSVFAPCIAANSNASSGETPCALGSRSYWISLNKAVDILRSPGVTGPGQRVEREVDEGKIVPVSDLSFRVDKGAQRRLIDQLTVNYASIWLHLALDALTGTPVPEHVQGNAGNSILPLQDPVACFPSVPLSRKLKVYLFTASSLAKPAYAPPQTESKKNAASAVPKKSVVNRDQLHNRHAIKRFLILIWFLDRLKSNRIVDYNPCLFRFRSHLKSSAEVLLTFARNFLTGENNFVRHLANLGVRLEVTQTPLDEYQLTVSNLAVDLRDGIRLVKLAELLLPLMPRTKSHIGDNPTPAALMSLVRFPAISRLQKIHNVGLALKAFEQHGRLCMADGTEIDPRDVVDGHREKSLALLWCLLLRYQVLALVNVDLLNQEIERLRSIQRGDLISDKNEIETSGEDVVHVKLFLWASLVCRLYELEVVNLDESFSDGRALCTILHHYLPTVMPKGVIRQITTSTASLCRLAQRNPYLTRMNRYNLQLFQRKLSYLGDVPVLLEPSVTDPGGVVSGLLPPGLVLATLAYLVSRLIPMGREKLRSLVEDHAARILQAAWRRHQQLLESKNLRLVSRPRPVTPTRVQLPTINREMWLIRIQQICRSYLARKHHAQLVLNRERQTEAAMCIQAYWRGFYVRHCLDQKHRAAIRIQSWWRGHQARQKWIALRQWVVNVQRVCRSYLARTHFSIMIAHSEHLNRAVVRIQSCWRGFRARRELVEQRNAAVSIQAWWRCQAAKQKWLLTRRWVVDVQRVGRAFLAQKHLSNILAETEVRNRAAIRIQSCWRGYSVRRQLVEERHAAICIQAWWRGLLARRTWLFTQQFVIDFQCICRGHLARKHVCNLFAQMERQNQAAISIQSCWRGFRARQLLVEKRSAAVRIQSWWRGHLARQKWLTLRRQVIIVQRACRAFLARRHFSKLVAEAERACQAAIRIQSCWRGFRVRRQQVKERNAAIVIQAWWRGVLARRRWLATYQATLIIQKCVRGLIARRKLVQLRETTTRVRAVTLIQAFWRGFAVRNQLATQHAAATRVQSWWRGRMARKRFVRTRQAVLTLQTSCRSFLARRRRQELHQQRTTRQEKAARLIQSAWRGYLYRQRLGVKCEAAKRIQHWWRGRLARLRWRRTLKAVLIIQRNWRLLLARRQKAACLIQRSWRTHGLRRYLHRRRAAAISIQSCWKGILVRRHLAELAGQRQTQKSKKIETKSNRPTDKLNQKPRKTGLNFNTTEAQRLIKVRKRLSEATQMALKAPDRCLSLRARAAATCLIHSKSVAQVLQAIKELEIFTRLSSEICFWSVGVLLTTTTTQNNANTGSSAERSPLLHLLFLDVIQACNRSVPHEDILLRVTGTLLNIARHRRLAEHTSLWWTPPSSQIDHETWISPALLSRARSRLSLSLSPTRRLPLTVEGEDESSVNPSRPLHRDHSGDRLITTYSSGPLDSQTSVAEALVGILLRTWRARPGTLGVRLFARTACLLAMLCDAIPAHLLPVTSLLPVIRELSDCLARRGSGPQPALSRADTVEHTTVLLEQSADRMRHMMSNLRKQLSYDLEWHLYPVKTRPDPSAAIDFLLLTVAQKSCAPSHTQATRTIPPAVR